MAKQNQENDNEMIETLRTRGLTCGKLTKMEQSKYKDAKDFRAVGFTNIANAEEANAKKIKELRKKVCLLR